jgi:hypothetical protein
MKQKTMKTSAMECTEGAHFGTEEKNASDRGLVAIAT